MIAISNHQMLLRYSLILFVQFIADPTLSSRHLIRFVLGVISNTVLPLVGPLDIVKVFKRESQKT